jgi:HK97 family phage major capsid protein
LNEQVGTGGALVYMPPGGLSQAAYGSLYGIPVMPIEYAATLGTVGDIILADLSAYASGTQGGVDSAMSMHLRFDYAETAFRFMFAVDGQPWLASPITPYKGGSNTLSPFVALATRS